MAELPDYHFWIGSYCKENVSNTFPQKVFAVSDIITIMRDTEKKPLNNSWMLYLLEFYIDKTKQIPVELDLICSFDDDGVFMAVFGGQNQHELSLPAIVGHSYIREIICDPDSHVVHYNIADLNTGKTDSYELNKDNIVNIDTILSASDIHSINDITFEGADNFSGIEWHNRINNDPFDLRYHTMSSLLQYGKPLSNESKYITYQPFKSLIPNNDGSGKPYPVVLEDPRIMKGCICYNVNSGNSNNGLAFNF